MKLSVGFLAGIAATEMSVREPVKSLHRLTGFSTEILQSGAFDHKSDKWRKKWIQHFKNNTNRMERNVNRKCGYYDANIHTFNYEYDSENACNGIKMILDGYSKWVTNHLSGCSGQRTEKFQQQRLDKWSGIFSEVLNCDAKKNSHTFIIPEEGWRMYAGNVSFAMGESIELSNLCNPNWVDGVESDDCEYYKKLGMCEDSAEYFVKYGVFNDNGIIETALNCPQCGCDTGGAANLNDIYAKGYWYTFVIPEDDWFMYSDYENAEMGETLELSFDCNPDFKDTDGDDCEDWGRLGYCDATAGDFIKYGVVNEAGILETGLQCPQCGCDEDGAANLNKVYFDKGRKLSMKKN